MADTVQITAGAGTTIATDDVGGVHYQQVKLVNGTLDSAIAAIVTASGELLVKLNAASATVPVSSASALDVSAATVPVQPAMASVGTVTSVAASATSVTLKAANASRKNITVYNDSSADLYLVTSAVVASTSVFTVKLAGGGIFYDDGYTGEIRGIWSSATGNARITERT